MGDPLARVTSVVINVVDFERQKVFWGAVLGTEMTRDFSPHFGWFEPQHDGGVSIALQAVEEPTDGPRRLHLDTEVDDLDAAAERIVELGGSVSAARSMGRFRWTVMLDPEGNEFCISEPH